MGDLVQREHSQNYGRKEVGAVGPGAHKKLSYLRNGARLDKGYFYGLIGSRIRALDWHQNQ